MKRNNTDLDYFVFTLLLILYMLYFASCKKTGNDVVSDLGKAKGMAALASTGGPGSLQVWF